MQNETIAIHAGYNKKEGNGSMAVPITQTTAYAFRDSEHAANLFALKELGPIYTRLTNPTTDVLEQRFAALEGGAAAICVASGQSAIFYAVANVAEAGDNILISDKLYGGSVTLLTYTLKRFGIKTKVFKINDYNFKLIDIIAGTDSSEFVAKVETGDRKKANIKLKNDLQESIDMMKGFII